MEEIYAYFAKALEPCAYIALAGPLAALVVLRLSNSRLGGVRTRGARSAVAALVTSYTVVFLTYITAFGTVRYIQWHFVDSVARTMPYFGTR